MVFNAAYKTLVHFRKTDVNKAVFVISRSKGLDGNLKYVHDELIKQQPHMKIHFVHVENQMNLKLFHHIHLISDTSYLIIEDYYLPIYLIKPQKELKVIQIWHAAGAFKKFGYSTVNTKFGPSLSYLKLVPIHSNYTHVYVSSNHVTSYYAEAFNMSEEHIFPFGPPRIDFFNDTIEMKKINEQIKDDFPLVELNEKVFILVAPTYRARGIYSESDVNFIDVLLDVSSRIGNHVQIIFKEHPYFESEELLRLKACPNITHSLHYSINEWMLIADALVTDYSSSVFDFSLLKKPLVHFVPDMVEYEKSRGLYEDIKQVSDGDIIMEVKQLIDWMNVRQKNESYDTTRMIEYNFDHTKDVSKKIVSHFREH